MYKLTNISKIKKMDFCVWNVVFQMDNEPLQFTTDFLYLYKEDKWIFNGLITHELMSLMAGNECIYCGENKIACFVASKHYEKVKEAIIKNDQILEIVSEETNKEVSEVSANYELIHDKTKWEQLAEKNRFYKTVIEIEKRNT